jgi:D-glycero-D-manno-heptose 1,7-bisphosphate phosphatase
MADFEFLEPDGIWCQDLRSSRSGSLSGRPALFLDRDGAVTQEVHFLHRPEDLALVPGAAEAIARANALGHPAVLVTNQSGLARGLFGWEAFAATQERLLEVLAAEGAYLDMVLACPFHPDGLPPYRGEHPCRKPAPGMLLRAGERLGVDLGGSWTVGDRARDLEAGRAAGLAGGLHVLTGHGAAEREAAAALGTTGFEVRLGESIAEAMTLPLLHRREESGEP